MATLMQNFTNMGTSIIIALVFGWELTLLILILVPILVIAVAAEMRLLSGNAAEDKKELERAGKAGIYPSSSTNVTNYCFFYHILHFKHQYINFSLNDEILEALRSFPNLCPLLDLKQQIKAEIFNQILPRNKKIKRNL